MINQRNRHVSFWQAFREYIKGVFDFRGFTTRQGFWKAVLGVYILDMSTGLLFEVLPVEIGLVIALLVGVVTFMCSLCLGVRRMRDICMSTKGIWTLYSISLIIRLFSMHSERLTIGDIIVIVVGFVIAVLPTNALLKYQDTTFGKWFVDSSLVNVIETHHTKLESEGF